MSLIWNETLPAAFCEGKLHPFLVPGVYEFFSSASGAILILIGVIGMSQSRLEMIFKMIYAGILVSGVGTVMMHWRRIAAFSAADTYPLLVTLTFGLVALFDTFVILVNSRRRASLKTVESPESSLSLDAKHQDSSSSLQLPAAPSFRAREWLLQGLEALVYTACVTYLVAGLILIIYGNISSFVAYYFGFPYGIFAIGGSVFLYFKSPHRHVAGFRRLAPLLILSIGLGLLSIAFKVIDSAACNNITVWLFPHALFHILVTYSAHCFVVMLAYHRALLLNPEVRRRPTLAWLLYLFPVVHIPEDDGSCIESGELVGITGDKQEAAAV